MKVVVLSCVFFIATAASVHAVEATQFALQDNPFNDRLARLMSEDETIDSPDVAKEEREDKEKPKESKSSNNAADSSSKEAEKPEPKKHMVVPGESLSNIADAHQTTWLRLFAKNEAIVNPDVITPGMEIIIPEPNEELPDRIVPAAAPVAPANPQAATLTGYTAPQPQVAPASSYAHTAGNTYAAGYCTWYAKNRRPDLPNMMGNAINWVSSAAARGYATGSAPRVGAIGQQGNHVVYVEAVNADGTVSISEMNYGGGLFVVHHRTVPASSFTYIY